MPKKKETEKLTVGVLNVVSHPVHGAAVYENLLMAAYKEAVPTKYWGNRYALIGSAQALPNGHIAGELLTYLNFDLTKPWLDLAKRAAATDEDIARIELPENFRPEFKRASYLLIPERHRILVDLSNFSINQAQKIFLHKLSSESVRRSGKADKVLVHIEPSSEELDRILTHPGLKELEMIFHRPNPDGFEETEEEINVRMDEDNAEIINEVIKANWAQGPLSPGNRTTNLAKVAKSNGIVRGKTIEDDGSTKYPSTESHPLLEVVRYVPEEETPISALDKASKWLLKKLRG